MGWEQLMIQVVYLMIATFIPIVGLALRKRIASQTKINELLLKEEWADAAARFAEQTYGALNGPDQLQHAMAWASARLKNNNINISSSELRGLIEKAVFNMKEGWNQYYYEEDDIL
jgi:hypothetical protein